MADNQAIEDVFPQLPGGHNDSLSELGSSAFDVSDLQNMVEEMDMATTGFQKEVVDDVPF